MDCMDGGYRGKNQEMLSSRVLDEYQPKVQVDSVSALSFPAKSAKSQYKPKMYPEKPIPTDQKFEDMANYTQNDLNFQKPSKNTSNSILHELRQSDREEMTEIRRNNKFDDRSYSPKDNHNKQRGRGGKRGGRANRRPYFGERKVFDREYEYMKNDHRDMHCQDFEKKEIRQTSKNDQDLRCTKTQARRKYNDSIGIDDQADKSMCNLLGYENQRRSITSIAKIFETSKRGKNAVTTWVEPDPGPSYIKKDMLVKLKESYKEKLRELTYREDCLEENVMEEHRSYGSFIQRKKRNLMDSYEVFMNLNGNYPFRSKLLRAHNLKQYKDDLPIYSSKEEFLNCFSDYDVVIFRSNAGSGKSTQLPQYLLDCTDGRILVTEPRVIAAENVAMRVQQEFDYEISRSLGYEKATVGYVAGPRYNIVSDQTKIVYMSEVILHDIE